MDICESCLTIRQDKDFLPNHKFCYQCVYKEKMKACPKKAAKKKNYCRICAAEVVHIDNAKKRQRSAFCSPECYEKGMVQLRNNHWTRKLRENQSLRVPPSHAWKQVQHPVASPRPPCPRDTWD